MKRLPRIVLVLLTLISMFVMPACVTDRDGDFGVVDERRGMHPRSGTTSLHLRPPVESTSE